MAPAASALGRTMSWNEEFARLVSQPDVSSPTVGPTARDEFLEFSGGGGEEEHLSKAESVKDQVIGFVESTGEMMLDLGRGVCEIARQSLDGAEETEIVRRMRGPMKVVVARLSFLNEYLPEDKDPANSWCVVVGVLFVAFLALSTGTQSRETVVPKKLYTSPPSAKRIELPDGRNIAYEERGVPLENARFSIVAPHSFLSSRLAGIPGIKESLLEEFGVQMVTYDLPGFGESDADPNRNLNSSAFDMLHLANALGIANKFWVIGYSGGGLHAWAAVRYIPDNLAGVAMFAPLENPYDTEMTKEERQKCWDKWTTKRKLMYFVARRIPSLLPIFYYRSFLSGKLGQPEKWLSLSLGKKDKALLQEPSFKEFWEKDVAESVRQGDAIPFKEESVLQVSDWGFKLSDLQVQKKNEAKGLLAWIRSLYSPAEREWVGFLGPIHIWQGTDDRVVPPSMTEYVRRVVPGATVHKLLGEGHFSYFWFCDDCHRQIFSTIFGVPRGPVNQVQDEPAPELPKESVEENTTELQET